MKIEIIGCGYIGIINAYILSKSHQVTLVDNDPKRINLMIQKKPLFDETNFDWKEFYSRVSVGQAGLKSDAAIFCVNAEIYSTGYDISNLENALNMNSSPLQIVRTTLGAVEARQIAEHFPNIVYWPEFLREGSALADFVTDPNFLYINGTDTSEETLKQIVGMYSIIKDLPTLATVKSVSNFFRALKVSFANQLGEMLTQLGVDIEQFFEIFLCLRGNADHRYLKPGAPYGGLCLPKETEYVANLLSHNFSSVENLARVTQNLNNALIKNKCDELLNTGITEISIKHFAFKKGTSDLRNSPTIELAEQLSKKIPVFDIDGSSLGKYPVRDEEDAKVIFDGWSSW